jgi:hypothetical protein
VVGVDGVGLESKGLPTTMREPAGSTCKQGDKRGLAAKIFGLDTRLGSTSAMRPCCGAEEDVQYSKRTIGLS